MAHNTEREQKEKKETQAYFSHLRKLGAVNGLEAGNVYAEDAKRFLVTSYVKNSQALCVRKQDIIQELMNQNLFENIDYTLEDLAEWKKKKKSRRKLQDQRKLANITNQWKKMGLSFYWFIKRAIESKPLSDESQAYIVTLTRPIDAEALSRIQTNDQLFFSRLPCDFNELKKASSPTWLVVLFLMINLFLTYVESFGVLSPGVSYALPQVLGGGVVSGYTIYLTIFIFSLLMTVSICRQSLLDVYAIIYDKCCGRTHPKSHLLFVNALVLASAVIPMVLSSVIFFGGFYMSYGVLPPFLMVWIAVMCIMLGGKFESASFNKELRRVSYHGCVNYLEANSQATVLEPCKLQNLTKEEKSKAIQIDGVWHKKRCVSWLDVKDGMLALIEDKEAVWCEKALYNGYINGEAKCVTERCDEVTVNLNDVNGETSPVILNPGAPVEAGTRLVAPYECVFELKRDAVKKQKQLQDAHQHVENLSKKTLFDDPLSNQWLRTFTLLIFVVTPVSLLVWGLMGNWSLGLAISVLTFACSRCFTIFSIGVGVKRYAVSQLGEGGMQVNFAHVDKLDMRCHEKVYVATDITGTLTIPRLNISGWLPTKAEIKDPLESSVLMTLLYQTERAYMDHDDPYAPAIAKWATGQQRSESVPYTRIEADKDENRPKSGAMGVFQSNDDTNSLKKVYVGDRRYINHHLSNEQKSVVKGQMDQLEKCALSQRQFPIFVMVDDTLYGALLVEVPPLKAGTMQFVQSLARLYLAKRAHYPNDEENSPVILQGLSGNNQACVTAIYTDIKKRLREDSDLQLSDEDLDAFLPVWLGKRSHGDVNDTNSKAYQVQQYNRMDYFTIAIGDAGNDVPMCKEADLPVAVTLKRDLKISHIDDSQGDKPALGLCDDISMLTDMMDLFQNTRVICQKSLSCLYQLTIVALLFATGGLYAFLHYLVPLCIVYLGGPQIHILAAVTVSWLMKPALVSVINQLLLLAATLYASYCLHNLKTQAARIVAKAAGAKILICTRKPTNTDPALESQLSLELQLRNALAPCELQTYTVEHNEDGSLRVEFGEILRMDELNKIREYLFDWKVTGVPLNNREESVEPVRSGEFSDNRDSSQDQGVGSRMPNSTNTDVSDNNTDVSGNNIEPLTSSV